MEIEDKIDERLMTNDQRPFAPWPVTMEINRVNALIGKAIGAHTIGGLVAGIAAHWLFVLLALIFA